MLGTMASVIGSALGTTTAVPHHHGNVLVVLFSWTPIHSRTGCLAVSAQVSNVLIRFPMKIHSRQFSVPTSLCEHTSNPLSTRRHRFSTANIFIMETHASLQYTAHPAHKPHMQEFLRFFLDGLAEDLNRRRSGPQPGGGCKGAGVSPIAQVPAAISDEALARLSADQQAARAWTFHLARNDSEVTSMFCGQLQSRIFCLTCGNVSYCFDPFFDLSVPLTSFGRRAGTASKNFNISGGVGGGVRSEGGHASTSGVSAAGGQPTPACTLEDCLQAFTKEESLDGDNRPICSGCRKRRKSEKSLAVHRFPPVLVIHLKRFQYDSSSREKIQTTVDFPISGLDLSPYSTTSAFLSSSRAGQGQLHRGAENGASAESGGNMSGELRDSTADAGSRRGRERELYSRDSHRKRSSLLSPLYELYGVCDHTGGLEGGHYIAHCRHNDPSSGGTNPSPSDGAEWYTFDDARVSRVNPARIGGSAAYVLFYRLMQREDENG